MSFTSKESITVPESIETCCNILSDPKLFIEFMSLSDITKDVEILNTDQVCLSNDLKVISDQESSNEEDEKCTRLHFKLTEMVKYVGVAKQIPVEGYIIASARRKIHVEHREASGGLVITDKIRTFTARTAQEPGTESQNLLDGALDELVMDAEPKTVTTTQNGADQATTITEDITGQTSWYLKYFVEMEARRSHQSTMAQYAEFIRQHSIK